MFSERLDNWLRIQATRIAAQQKEDIAWLDFSLVHKLATYLGNTLCLLADRTKAVRLHLTGTSSSAGLELLWYPVNILLCNVKGQCQDVAVASMAFDKLTILRSVIGLAKLAKSDWKGVSETINTLIIVTCYKERSPITNETLKNGELALVEVLILVGENVLKFRLDLKIGVFIKSLLKRVHKFGP